MKTNSNDPLVRLRISDSQDLRWKCDVTKLSFETTAQIDPSDGVLGQPTAREALTFGIQCMSPGQNIYVRGPRGTGKIRMVRHLLETLRPQTNRLRDYCYVHNFDRPDRPRLITLNAGQAPQFRNAMESLGEFVNEGLPESLDGEPYLSQRQAIQDAAQTEMRNLSKPLEQSLAEASMTLVTPNQGTMMQAAIFPVFEGQAVPHEQYRLLLTQEKITQQQYDAYEEGLPNFEKQLQEVTRKISEVYRDAGRKMKTLIQDAAVQLLSSHIDAINKQFGQPHVASHIRQVVEDITEHRLQSDDNGQPDFKELYGVNVVLTHTDQINRPKIEESTPNLINLLGTVEPQWASDGRPSSDYRGVRAGALLRADQGYLILDVNDLMSEPGAYRAVMRTLRTGLLEIVPPEAGLMRQQIVTQPEPIKVNVRVILIGDASTYLQLDYADPDFRELFKVLADFDNEIDRDQHGIDQYASVLAQLCADESLCHFHKSAVGALVEHGARIVARRNKLTSKLGRIADIAREAVYVADGDVVMAQDVKTAVRRTKARASLPSRKFQSMLESGTIIVKTTGCVVGQINGLAVMRSGPLTYGFPARITTTISPGSAGLINIEGQASMSGAIHTKGFQILGGLLRHLIAPEHPLAFSASIAFEQSYGGIDGDSASGAEIVCLLSALTGVPIKQTMAMTGAIDQHGHVEAIGGVNEKIEGFFDACEHFGLTGDQGVVIPKANAGDLMLRQDVVDACLANQFHVYAVERIEEAIELMTGVVAGTADSKGNYPQGSVLQTAVKKAHDYWKMSLSSPEKLAGLVEATNDLPSQANRGDEDCIA
jgi:predicted ATP-dependent protease